MTVEQGSRAGRPTIYLPEYCDQVIEHMQDGASLTSFAGSIRVSRATITVWRERYPEFKDACDTGKAAACAWWEKRARAAAADGKGSAPIILFGMKCMGVEDWVDKQSIEHSGPNGAELTVKFVGKRDGGD